MIPIAEPSLEGNELKYVEDCIKGGWISSIGSYVKKFEEEFAKYCGVEYGISVSNGTAALHLALLALGIKKGDEIIMPNLTFVSPASMTKLVGANPVLVDVDPETWCINPDKIEEKITKKTRAIIPVHLYGMPCNMDSILKIAGKYNLFVIEDAAEAHGAEYKGKKVGSFGDLAVFSFYGNKIITTGEGGMVLTDNEKLAEKIGYLKNHAMKKEKRYWHESIGFNYRLTNIQAAIGLAQLEQIDKFIEKKIENAKIYNKLLKNIPGVTLPPQKPDYKNVFWMYSILIGERFGISRDELIKKLRKGGIESRKFFYPVNEMPPYKTNEVFPVSKRLSEQGINLPSSVKLTKEEIEKICEVIRGCGK